MTPSRRAFHVMCHAQETCGGRPLQFFQSIVVYADDAETAKERVTALLARQAVLVIGFEDDHVYESDPAKVGYETKLLEEGVVGMSGRIYIVARQSLWMRLRDSMSAFVRRGGT